MAELKLYTCRTHRIENNAYVENLFLSYTSRIFLVFMINEPLIFMISGLTLADKYVENY